MKKWMKWMLSGLGVSLLAGCVTGGSLVQGEGADFKTAAKSVLALPKDQQSYYVAQLKQLPNVILTIEGDTDFDIRKVQAGYAEEVKRKDFSVPPNAKVKIGRIRYVEKNIFGSSVFVLVFEDTNTVIRLNASTPEGLGADIANNVISLQYKTISNYATKHRQIIQEIRQ